MTLTDFPEVRDLTVREKLQLVDELWTSIGPELATLEVTEEEQKALDTRWAAYIKNPASALTLEQFKTKMKSLRA
jgi:putative addiction module component (TIGR02574 family)